MCIFKYLIIYLQQLQRCIFDLFLVRTVVHQLEAELRCLKMRKGKKCFLIKVITITVNFFFYL